MSQDTFDVAIIGAGMVGASIAYHLAGKRRVVLLEAESAPGYHSTGRSAAMYVPAYGPAAIRALTRASGAFFNAPPEGLVSGTLLRERGALFVANPDQYHELRHFYEEQRTHAPELEWLESPEACERIPVLRNERVSAAVYDPRAFDIDVDLMLQGFLRGAREQGAALRKDAQVSALTCHEDGWQVECESGQKILARQVVNAAGAWVDDVAALAGLSGIGIEPRRRSAFLFEPPAEYVIDNWPLIIAHDESWYIKPDAGLLLGSPANADLVPPHDVVAEDMDIALAAYRIEENTSLEIQRPRSTWAGLRCFVSDGEPVLGFDAQAPGFFWAAALGGYGIQSAPAVGRLSAAMLCHEDTPPEMLDQGLEVDAVSPQRFKKNSSQQQVTE